VKHPILATCVLAILGSWHRAVAESPPLQTLPCPAAAAECCPRALLSGCPDDYCRKPCPRVGCLPCGQCDDYCRKPCPRI